MDVHDVARGIIRIRNAVGAMAWPAQDHEDSTASHGPEMIIKRDREKDEYDRVGFCLPEPDERTLNWTPLGRVVTPASLPFSS